MKPTQLKVGRFYIDPFGRPAMCVRAMDHGCVINVRSQSGSQLIEVHDDPAGDCFTPAPAECQSIIWVPIGSYETYSAWMSKMADQTMATCGPCSRGEAESMWDTGRWLRDCIMPAIEAGKHPSIEVVESINEHSPLELSRLASIFEKRHNRKMIP